jgi:hypothetical protein
MPWSEPTWTAAATTLPIAAPQLTLLSAAREAQQVHYRVHIISARAAPILMLAFPPEANVHTVQLDGAAMSAVPAMPRRLSNGWSQLRLFGPLPQGVDLSFDAAAVAFDLPLLDQSFGLPAAGLSLQHARPGVAVPSHEGDGTIAMRRYRMQP